MRDDHLKNRMDFREVDEQEQERILKKVKDCLHEGRHRKLSDIAKKLVTILTFEGLSASQIARILDVSVPAINYHRKSIDGSTRQYNLNLALVNYLHDLTNHNAKYAKQQLLLYLTKDVNEYTTVEEIEMQLYSIMRNVERVQKYKAIQDSMMEKIIKKAEDTMDLETMWKIKKEADKLAADLEGIDDRVDHLLYFGEGGRSNSSEGANINTTINVGTENFYKESIEHIQKDSQILKEESEKQLDEILEADEDV